MILLHKALSWCCIFSPRARRFSQTCLKIEQAAPVIGLMCLFTRLKLWERGGPSCIHTKVWRQLICMQLLPLSTQRTSQINTWLLYEAHIALKGVCTVHARRSTSTSCRRAINSLLSCSSSSSSPAPFTPRDLFEKKAIKWQCHWQENTRVWVGVCVCGWRAQS